MKERLGMETIFSDSGFITYWVRGDNVFISDLYVMPHRRRSREAWKLADKVAQVAIAKGKQYLTSRCDLNTATSLAAYEAQRAYGFTKIREEGTVVDLVKDLKAWKAVSNG